MARHFSHKGKFFTLTLTKHEINQVVNFYQLYIYSMKGLFKAENSDFCKQIDKKLRNCTLRLNAKLIFLRISKITFSTPHCGRLSWFFIHSAISTPPGCPWGSTDWVEPIEFDFPGLECEHQDLKQLEPKKLSKAGFFL